MKKRKIKKTLVLNKETIINLENVEKRAIKGGTLPGTIPECWDWTEIPPHCPGGYSETNLWQECEPCEG